MHGSTAHPHWSRWSQTAWTMSIEISNASVWPSMKNQSRPRLLTGSATTKNLVARPSIACIEWLDRLMAAGNWLPELVDAAGGVNLFGETGVHSPWLEWSHVVAADPDIIVIMPCGFDIARASSEMPNLTDRPEWSALTAVRSGKVFVVDGHHYFNRPGPRLLDSLEILCEIIHPERFSFGHRGTGWVDWKAASV